METDGLEWIEAFVEKDPEIKFVHTGVENASKRYPAPVTQAPCIVVCLDCWNDARRTVQYQGFAQAEIADRFIVYQ